MGVDNIGVPTAKNPQQTEHQSRSGPWRFLQRNYIAVFPFDGVSQAAARAQRHEQQLKLLSVRMAGKFQQQSLHPADVELRRHVHNP
jgi:hypothetical protein